MKLTTERNNSKKRNNTFAGKIYESDFNTEYPKWPESVASRIASDMKFDESCYKNALIRDSKQKTRNIMK